MQFPNLHTAEYAKPECSISSLKGECEFGFFYQQAQTQSSCSEGTHVDPKQLPFQSSFLQRGAGEFVLTPDIDEPHVSNNFQN